MIVDFSSITNDPCYNYQSLDRPWRATTESDLRICDSDFSWNGWYRLYHYGMNIQMPESCVDPFSCNAGFGLWLNGSHPQIEDGVVTREVCAANNMGSCCDVEYEPIRVKACPGNYYVYELVNPYNSGLYYCSGYCTDISTISQTIPTTTPAMITGSSFTLSDPCSNYNILDNNWRTTLHYWYWYGFTFGHDDTMVKWDGWYRLFINGLSAQMPDWCVSSMACGGYTSLWLGGSHPGVEDGVVTRDVYGSYFDQCSRFTSNPIQVKACPGDYYVYKLTRPNLSIADPVYCAVAFKTPSVDPCDSYNILDEPWRSIDNYHYYFSNQTMSDYFVNWNGWYRLFINGQSAQMSESCVTQWHCGTYCPLWLKDPHPKLEDGVVTRFVCMSAWEDCCGIKFHPIQVKACPGNYYVYEFVRPIGISAYCAEVTGITTETPHIESITTPITITDKSPAYILPSALTDQCSALNCTEDEWCGEMNGVYGCFCNKNQTRSDPDSFDFFETCESSTGSISISRCQLFEAGFSADGLHLNDPSCKGIIQNGRVEFSFDNNGHTCGTNLVANGTHIIYENFILGAPGSSEGLISRERILQISFSCVYPQTQTLSMIEINPLESVVHKTLPAGHGMYQVRMIPYQDVGFSQPFNGSVNAELNQEIFVEVRVDGVDSRQLVTVIDTCWATPVNDPDYSLRWDLITGECPNPHDNTVKLLQNGVSTSSRFSFRMFIFNSNFTKVYLHCAVHLCILANNYCSAPCVSGYHQRIGRSLDFHDSSSISMGPLIGSDGNTDISHQMKSVAPCLCSSLMQLLVSLMTFFTFPK
nr:pancreatic secretory granule membrane major glycoprotein GP2-like [Misgurnus anguillicaudatus]